MSKLLDLLAQQKALVEQIKKLEADENEAKVIKFVEELDALREKYGYEVPQFVGVVHSYYNVESPAKNAKSVSEKTPKEAKPQYKVVIDGVEVVLKEASQGKMKPELEKAVKAAGFTKYGDYLKSLKEKYKVADFDALIKKLGGVPATA
ncbi:hypothetical protein [Pseudomonas juntendi]|uniref:hypothetical protein n=1 Tax=Pseudomonas juntendi TaxID=2666183 RepID=UPI001F245DB0|nr:hypothetical protein [Pseudomonas juntendi]MCO7054503.1 hypothetical protein [Pseudomonas juntendi]UJM12393.1 hypothetical protein L1P09_24410 [Pseudomonas juntendi]UXA38627.1 hypothetical protein KZA81_24850 [Pseudomonas juntendi]